MKGSLIVFEGIDNCGKDSMMYLVRNHIQSNTCKVELIPSVTPTDIGRLIRKDTLDNYSDKDRLVALFIADFYNKVNMAKEAMSEGKVVLVNRWITSTMAYCGSITKALAINSIAGEVLQPDLFIYLNISVEESIKRQAKAAKRKDIYSTTKFLTDAKCRYESIIKNEYFNAVEIDAMQNKKFVLADIIDAMIEKGLMDG